MLYLFSGGSIKGGGQFTASSGAAVAFSGEAAVDRAGLNVCGAGDLDGDGADDLIISAPTNDGGYPEGGKAYLLISPW